MGSRSSSGFDSPARRNEPGAPALRILGLAVAVALIAAAPQTGRAAPPADPGPGHSHTVTIEGLRFDPQTLTVRRGDRITWVNKDPIPHTVTAKNGKFDSHQIAPDGSWTYVARKAGEYDYVCTLHVTMKGKLEVR